MSKIKGVLYRQDRDEPEVIEIEKGYREIQRIVGGLIEVVNPNQFGNEDDRIRGMEFYIDEEGRLKEGNIVNIEINSEYPYYSVLVGDVLVLGEGEESIPEERIEQAIDSLREMRLAVDR